MPLLVVCEDCAREYDVLTAAAGRKMRCRCGAILQIPSSAPDDKAVDEWITTTEPRPARLPAAVRRAKPAAGPSRRAPSRAGTSFIEWLTSPTVVLVLLTLGLVGLGGVVSAMFPSLQHGIAGTWLGLGALGFLAAILFVVAEALEVGLLWVLLVVFVQPWGPWLFIWRHWDRCRWILFFKFIALLLGFVGAAASSLGGMYGRGSYEYARDFPFNRSHRRAEAAPELPEAAWAQPAVAQPVDVGGPLENAERMPEAASPDPDPIPAAPAGDNAVVGSPAPKVVASFELLQYDRGLGAAEAALQALADYTEVENVTVTFTREMREVQVSVELQHLPRLWPQIQRSLERAGFQVAFRGHRPLGAKHSEGGLEGKSERAPARTMSPSF